jgi:hypothetical protein
MRNTIVFAFKCFKISVLRSPACHAGALAKADQTIDLPPLLGHFLELRAEHIYVSRDKIASKCNVEPVSLRLRR